MHKKVTIDESCIACGACVEICPDVFDLEDEGDIAFVKEEANLYLDEKNGGRGHMSSGGHSL
jgi:ferredoxin